MVGELSALESEQRHIDARAARVEKRLRYLMDTGTPSPITLEKLFWQIERTHAHTHPLWEFLCAFPCVFLCAFVRIFEGPPISVECCATERWVDMKGGDGGCEGGGEGREKGGGDGGGERRETSLGWGDKGALHGGNDNCVR